MCGKITAIGNLYTTVPFEGAESLLREVLWLTSAIMFIKWSPGHQASLPISEEHSDTPGCATVWCDFALSVVLMSFLALENPIKDQNQTMNLVYKQVSVKPKPDYASVP